MQFPIPEYCFPNITLKLKTKKQKQKCPKGERKTQNTTKKNMTKQKASDTWHSDKTTPKRSQLML